MMNSNQLRANSNQLALSSNQLTPNSNQLGLSSNQPLPLPKRSFPFRISPRRNAIHPNSLKVFFTPPSPTNTKKGTYSKSRCLSNLYSISTPYFAKPFSVKALKVMPLSAGIRSLALADVSNVMFCVPAIGAKSQLPSADGSIVPTSSM